MVLFHLMLYGVYAGRFDKATLALEMLSSFTQTLEVQSPLRGIWGYVQEMFFEMAGFPEKCDKAVSEGLEFFRYPGEGMCMDEFLFFQAILNSLNMNDTEKARQFINQFSTFRTNPRRENWAGYPSSTFIITLGQRRTYPRKYDQAAIHGEQDLRYALDTGAPMFSGPPICCMPSY